MLYELLVGVTPFHCFNMKDLIRQINDGRYKLSIESEPISIETCIFLLECLQTFESERSKLSDL